MLANPRVVGYLNQALGHELSAVQHYLTQACLCDLWGLPEAAAGLRREADEECEHAQRIIGRLLLLGLTPHATQLAPARPGRDRGEMLRSSHAMETAAVRLYAEAEATCVRLRDVETAQLFAALRRDEERHLAALNRILAAPLTPQVRGDDTYA
jgi:bacterioferritin